MPWGSGILGLPGVSFKCPEWPEMLGTFLKLPLPLPSFSPHPLPACSCVVGCQEPGTGTYCSRPDLVCCPHSPAPPPELSHLLKGEAGVTSCSVCQVFQAVCCPEARPQWSLCMLQVTATTGGGAKSHPFFLLEEPLTTSQGPGHGVTNDLPSF